ncbi:uncharacterized protein TrAtP1_003167 [Trichoderma atroviride]|uniref:uncharacterized protein n=1 Tax=Hypocrea atroviridis TaxID=63577 RepID=UPI003333835B|nr:hypothetical protein TrAtP1_003167 [Trichoderma atroviride]
MEARFASAPQAARPARSSGKCPGQAPGPARASGTERRRYGDGDGRQSHPTVYLAWLVNVLQALQTHSRPTNPQSGLTATGCLACADPLAPSIAPVYAPKGSGAWSLVPPGLVGDFDKEANKRLQLFAHSCGPS